jgi:hypothetical protein
VPPNNVLLLPTVKRIECHHDQECGHHLVDLLVVQVEQRDASLTLLLY